MELELIKEKDLPILSRKRITFMLKDVDGATPSRRELLKMVADKVKAKEDTIIIKHVYPQYGQSKVKIFVHIYSDKNKMIEYEHPNLVKKHQEPPKKEEEKPTESTKEESKPEEGKGEEAATTEETQPKEEEKSEEVKEEKAQPQEEEKPVKEDAKKEEKPPEVEEKKEEPEEGKKEKEEKSE